MDAQQSADIHHISDENQEDKPTKLVNSEEFDVATHQHEQKLVEISENLAAIDDQEIIDACNARQAIDEKRAELNDQAADIRDNLKNLGISGPAFNAAYARFKQDAHKRDIFDQEFAKCANAMGVEYQYNLFNK